MNDPLPEAAPPTLILTGPTAVGKTGLAVALAERFNLEIISADSMQVYRGMEIGTAQPDARRGRARPLSRLRRARPGRPVQRGRLARPVRRGPSGHRRARRPAALRRRHGDVSARPQVGSVRDNPGDPAARARLEAEAAAHGSAALHERLARIDPVAAGRIAPGDSVRIVRALEVHAATGRPISQWQSQWEKPRPRLPHVVVVLVAGRAALRERIARRTDEMLAAGWIDETRALLGRGIPPAQHCFKALGYREIIEHIEGRLAFGPLRERIVTRTGQFSKRQMIWLRRERPAAWLEIDFDRPAAALHRVENMLAKIGGRSV